MFTGEVSHSVTDLFFECRNVFLLFLRSVLEVKNQIVRRENSWILTEDLHFVYDTISKT